jgi:shikimate kinase
MGAGKSTIGRCLATKLCWTFTDLDQEIERHEHRDIAAIFRKQGEAHFRKLESLYLQQVSSCTDAVIALGGGTFIAAQNRELAEKTGLTVWLKVSFPNVAARVKIDGTRPKFADTDQARRLYESREAYYRLAAVHVSTDSGTPESVADEILGVVRNS